MSLTVVFMQPGDSVENSLTRFGMSQVRRVAKQMAQEGFKPDVVLTGPLRKSAETAQVVSDAYEAAGHRLTLRSDFRLRRGNVADALTRLTGEQNVLVIVSPTQMEGAVEHLTKSRLPPREPEGAQATFVTINQPSWAGAIRSPNSKIVRTIKPSDFETLN